MTTKLKAPFPYFGGKSRIASVVWQRFGRVRNYCEPFFGSGAVLLQRPTPFEGVETINDKDRFVANFWRAIKADPDAVAEWCDWPVNEADLHARHRWLVNETGEFQRRMLDDPEYHDARVAAWWVWGLCQWIGSGWCSGGLSTQLPHLGDAGRGVHRPSQKLPHLGNAGRGGLTAYFSLLADRFRRVRVCCGDWSRVLGESPTVKQGLTAVFLDPPYSAEADRDMTLYAHESGDVAHDVRAWCLDRSDDPRLRIALCGYEGEHDELESSGWSVIAWKAKGGYANQSDEDNVNARRERVWFSPHCLKSDRMPLFAEMNES